MLKYFQAHSDSLKQFYCSNKRKAAGIFMRQKEKTENTVIRRDLRSDGEYDFSYELLMKESRRVASFGIPLYSIRIEMRDNQGNTTSADIKDAFADAGKAIVLYEKIVRNLATPIDLAYIHEDEMS